MQTWTTPTFEEVKMDAEIGSYQVDDGPIVASDLAENHGVDPNA